MTVLGRKAAGLMLAGVLAAMPAQAVPERPALRVSVPEGAQPETVFDWSAEACEPWHVPDAPARAWRGSDGQVRLLASHLRARVMTGADLDSVRPGCRIAYESEGADNPGAHDDHGWIAAPYALGDGRVYALVHNEFHGHRRPELCPKGGYMACWWNSITLARSQDDGDSFAAETDFVAGIPYRFRGNLGRRAGLFGPSNIVAHEGWFHAMAFAEALGAQKRGVCLMRTRDLGDPASWRAWDGQAFTIAFDDPYHGPDIRPSEHVCTPLPPDRLPFTVTSLVRHEGTGRFVALMAGERRPTPSGRPVTGIWASVSADLLSWSRPHLVWAAPLLTHRDCRRPEAYYYPSLLDPDSPSRNFETTDGRAWIYLTRLRLENCKPGKERDLIRIPVVIAPTDTAAVSR